MGPGNHLPRHLPATTWIHTPRIHTVGLRSTMGGKVSDRHLSTDHHRLREKVRAFADAEVTPRVPNMERAATVDTELATLIAQQGWVGVTIPAAFGGMGAGHLAKTIIIEELSRASGAMGAMIQASQLGTAK